MFNWLRKLGGRPEYFRPEVKLLLQLIDAGSDWQTDGQTWYHPSGVNIRYASKIVSEIAVKFGSKSLYDCGYAYAKGTLSLSLIERAVIAGYLDKSIEKGQTDKVLEVAKKITQMYGDNK